MKPRPAVVAFDIIETVFSLEPLRGRLEAVGLRGDVLDVWFAQVLRDAFALDATGVYLPFRDVAAGCLEQLLVGHGVPAGQGHIDHVLAGFAELPPHADAMAAFRVLREGGSRIVALTNGNAQTTRGLLERAGLLGLVERVTSVEEIRHWKPRREVYLHAAASAQVEPSRMALVAAHAWDIHGAGRAGLTTAFVSRGVPYPATMQAPDVVGETLLDAAHALMRLAAVATPGAD
ncbi:haloacid dehalogenase type II [bacterium]|nr:MAG: haloacid dehalogenase type II [bacterium]